MEFVEDLVSIITPCYNAEAFIDSYIKNVAEQTYKNIELILINDGSTDNTENIILANQGYIESCGVILKYISYKDNRGQAYAVNLALKNIHGEFFINMDCDDIMTPDSIAQKVQLLKNNPKYSFCGSKVDLVDAEDNILPSIDQTSWLKRENIFWDILFLNCQPFHCLCRSATFFDTITKKDISVKRAGQNFQILLPLAYSGKFGFIANVLSKYVQHENSHSHKIKNRFRHTLELYSIAKETLLNMNMNKRDYEWGCIILNINKIRLCYSVLVRIKRQIIPFHLRNAIKEFFTRKRGVNVNEK